MNGLLRSVSAGILPLALALLLVPATHAAGIADFKASYLLKRGNLHIGTSTLSLVNTDNNRYRYESRSWPVAWVSWLLKDKLHETSTGWLDEDGLRPLSYHYSRSGGKKERNAELSFDWNALTVANRVDGSNWSMTIPAGTVDKLASQLAMMLALGRGEKDITFNIADGGKLKEYRFKVIGEEILELPSGRFETVKITKLRDNKKRETYIWCAPELGYLPIRIWQRDKDGAIYQSDLESYSQAPLTARK